MPNDTTVFRPSEPLVCVEDRHQSRMGSDRLFSGMLCVLGIALMVLACFISAGRWEASFSGVLPLWGSVLLLGSIMLLIPVLLALLRSDDLLARQAAAVLHLSWEKKEVGVWSSTTEGDGEGKFRDILNSLKVIVFEADPLTFQCTFISRPVETLFGYPCSAWTAEPRFWLNHMHAGDRDRILEECKRRLEAQTPYEIEYRLMTSDERAIWVHTTVTFIAGEGGRVLVRGVITDITERRRLDVLKNEFVSTVSHELRTPLTSIRGSLGLIHAGVSGPLPAKAKAMVEIAVKNCDRLVSLVNDILDVETISSGKMVFRMKAVELGSLLKQSVDATRPFADSLGVRLELKVPEAAATVYADPERLTQVVANLVSNACKFSPRGSAVSIREVCEGGKVRVSIEDRGRGIPEEFRSRIFEKFAQADGRDNASRVGTGLGLSISKALMERMGGKIGYVSEVGKGSTFHFELDERRPEILPSREGNNRPRILIVEDESDIAKILRELLDGEGFDSDIARTLQEANLCLAKETYSAMTLDLVLPDGSAVPFVRELRKNPATAHLPLIIVSAYLDDARHELAGQAFEIVDWVEKPIDTDRLSKALAHIGRGSSGVRPSILHVEDDPDIAKVVVDLLQDTAEVENATSVSAAWEKLKSRDYDLLILDIGLPDGSGLELLPALNRSTSVPIPSLIFSAHEISPRTAKYVTAALLKSKTSNAELLRRIRLLLPNRGVSKSIPAGPEVTA